MRVVCRCALLFACVWFVDDVLLSLLLFVVCCCLPLVPVV